MTLAGADLDLAMDAHRRELTGFCYRMLGAGSEAEDAVQETMVHAWRAIDSFEGRSSLRSWLYRIANNVCIDMLRSPQRRARPMDLGVGQREGRHVQDSGAFVRHKLGARPRTVGGTRPTCQTPDLRSAA